MKKRKKHIVVNLRKANATVSFSFLLLTAFFAACATPTVSSDDSDGGGNSSSSAEQKESFFNSDIDYGTMTDGRDGQVYRTVKVGEQTWMAENLNYESPNSYCYENNASNCVKYGRLYTWVAAVGETEDACGYGHECNLDEDVQGICPDGWHLPANTDWNALFSNVGGRDDNAGKALRSQTGWAVFHGKNGSRDGNGTDAVGFRGLPAGRMITEGDFRYVGEATGFWGSTEYNSDNASCAYLFNGYDHVGWNGGSYKYEGYYVRCVKD